MKTNKMDRTLGVTLGVTLLLALTGFVTSYPAEQCAGYCKDTGKTQYEIGSHYVYYYEAETVSAVSGTEEADEEGARLKFSAIVDIHALTPCEFNLQVKNVSLNDAYRPDFSAAIEKNSLRFWNQNGIIKRLCPATSDSEWVLNIKRGILSIMQNSMEDFQKQTHLYETDVLGTCQTLYEPLNPQLEGLSWQDGFIVEKRKDLQKCSNHVVSQSEKASPLKKSASLLGGGYECMQVFSASGLIQGATCTEVQLFQPFSNNQNGARTVITSSFKFREERSHDPSTPVGQVGSSYKTLNYQAVDSSVDDDIDDSSDENTGSPGIDTILQNLHAASANGLSSAFPVYYNQLISELQRLDSSSLKDVISTSLETSGLDRKLMIEALTLVKTDASFVAIKDLYSSGLFSTKELDSILSTIPFIKSPTLQTVSILADLTSDSALDSKKMMLTVSSTVHSFCQKNPGCGKEEPVKQILSWIEAILGDSCSANSHQRQDDVVVALKAIGNFGFISDIATLTACFESSDNPVKIRLAAIDALRKMDCATIGSSKVLQVYSKFNENAEVRIASYVASVRCPSDYFFTVVKSTLLEEKTNQVGSFVWTHLENLHNKHTPYQHAIRSIISKSQLKNKFNTDARRFSRNYEVATYFDSINVGTAVDSNVVFSPESYLPRSLNLNLTVDVFGESVNLLDFGARIEGFESIVEGIFEKNGYFPDENIRSLLENLKSQNSAEENEIGQLSDTFMSSRTLPKNPQGSIYTRFLGNELYLKQFDSLKDLINLSKNQLTLNGLLQKALLSEVDLAKTTRFLDLSYEIPTSIGLPLKLKIDGTTALKFQLSAKSSLEDLFKPNSAAYIKLFLNPSAVVQINGEMMLDAGVVTAGLRSSNQLHTNTYVDLEVDFQSGKVLDVKLNVPRPDSNVLSVTSQLFAVSDGVEQELEGITEDSEEWEYCTPDGFSKVVGFQACSKLRYANASQFEYAPYFPLTGPFNFLAQLKKSDNFTAYHFRYQNQKTDADESGNGAMIFFETPGSKVERQFEVSYFLDSRENSLRLNAQAEYRNASLAVLHCSMGRSLKPESTRLSYDFDWDLKLLELPRLHGNGNMYSEAGSKYVGSSVELHGIAEKPISVKADLSLASTKNLALTIASGKDNVISIGGNLKKTPSRLDSKFSLSYALPGRRSEEVRMSYLWSTASKSVTSKDKMQLSIKSSEFPAYNTKVIWALIRGQNYFDMNTNLAVGISNWQSRQMYRNWRTTGGHVHYSIEASLVNQLKNLDYRLELDYQRKAKQGKLKFLAQLNDRKKILLLTSYDRKAPLDRNFELTAQSPWSSVAVSASLVSDTVGRSSEEDAVVLKSTNPDIVTLRIYGNGTLGDSIIHSLQIDGGYRSHRYNKYMFGGSSHSFFLTVQLPDSHYVKDPINIKYVADKLEQPSHVRLDVSYKDYSAYYTLIRRRQSDLAIKVNLQTPSKNYSGEISGESLNDESHLTVDLNLSKCIHFEFNRKNASAVDEIDSKLFWDYKGNRNKTIGVYLYNSEMEKTGKLYLEDLFMGVKMKLATDSRENHLRHNFLFSSSWGKSEESLFGELKLDGHMSDHRSHQFNSALGKNTTRQEFTVSTSIATPVKNFELQWADLTHVKEISDESFAVDSPLFWTSTSTKVFLSWHEMSDPLLDGQDLEYFGTERLGPQYFTRTDPAHHADLPPNAWIERKLGAKLETTISNQKASAQVLYFNDYSDLSAIDVSVNYTLDENGLKTSLDSSYNYALPLLHIDLNGNSTESRANLKFTSPIKTLASFTSNLVVSSSLNYLIFETKWDPNKNVTFWYSVDLPAYIGAEFSSPFENYKVLTFQFKSKDLVNIFASAARKEADVSFQFNDQKAAGSFSSLKRDSGFDGSLMVSIPSLMDTLHFSIHHDLSDVKFSEKLSVKSGALKQTVIEASFDLNFQDYRHFTISTDFETMNSLIFVEIVNKFELGGINCSLNGKWNKEYVLLKLNGEYVNEIDETLVQFQFSASGSPFRKDYDVTFQHSHNSQNYDSLLILPFGTKLEHSLKIHNTWNWENSLILKSNSKTSAIVNEQKLDSSRFENSMVAEIYGQKSSFHVSARFDETEKTVKDGSLQILTPWSDPISAKYSFAKALKTIVLDSGEKSLLFSDHLLTLRYQNNKEITLKASGHAATALYFVYDVAVSSPHYNNSHVTIKCDWTQPLKVGWVAFKHNQHSYEVHFDYLRQSLTLNSSLKLTQDSVQISVSELNYNLATANAKFELSTIVKNEKYNILLESRSSENKHKAQLLLNLPFNNWKNLVVSFDYDVTNNVMMAVLNYEKNADTLTLSATFVQTWFSAKASMALNTNFLNKAQIYSLAGEYDFLASNDLTAAMIFNNNDEASKFSAKLRNKQDEKVVQLEFSTPYEGFRLINGSFSLLNRTVEHIIAFGLDINNFKLASGVNIDILKLNYSSSLLLAGLPNGKDLSASFELLKDDATSFNASISSGHGPEKNFIKIQGSHIATDFNSKLAIELRSSVKNYEHSALTIGLTYPDLKSTQHQITGNLVLSSDVCSFSASFNPSTDGFNTGSFNTSFPKSWGLSDVSGLYKISQFVDDQLSAGIYLQVGNTVNKLSFSGDKDQASLSTTLDLPILKRNAVNASLARFTDETGNYYFLKFNLTDDSMIETFFASVLKLTQTELLITCQSSLPEFQTAQLSSNLNIIDSKALNLTFKRNDNVINATLVSEPDLISLQASVRDKYLANWDVAGTLKSPENSFVFMVEKEDATWLKLLCDFNLKPSASSASFDVIFAENFSSQLKAHLSLGDVSNVQASFALNNETKLVLKGNVNSNLTEGDLYLQSVTNLLPYPHQNTTLKLVLTPKEEKTAFVYSRVNQKVNKMNTGYFSFTPLRSALLIENPRSSEALKFGFDYDFTGENKSVAIQVRNGTKFLNLEGSVLASSSKFDLRLKRISDKKRSTFNAKYTISKDVDFLLLFNENSVDLFKLKIFVDSFSKVNAVFSASLTVLKTLPSLIEVNYDVTQRQKMFVVSVKHRGSSHMVNALIDRSELEGHFGVNVSSQFLPVLRKVCIETDYDFKNPAARYLNLMAATDIVTGNFSLKSNSSSSLFASFGVNSANKNHKGFPLGVDLSVDLSGENKIVAVTISKPGQNLKDEFSAQLNAKNLTANSELIWKKNGTPHVTTSLSYDFTMKREFLYRSTRDESFLQEVGFSLSDIQNSSLFVTNIWNITQFRLNYNVSKIESMNLEMNYLSQNLNCVASSFLVFGRSSVDSSLTFFWNKANSNTSEPIDLKVHNQLSFEAKERFIKANLSLGGVDFYKFLLSYTLNGPDEFGVLDIVDLLLYQGATSPGRIDSEMVFYERIWGSDLKLNSFLIINKIAEPTSRQSILSLNLTLQGEPKLSTISTFDHNEHFNRLTSNINYQSERSHEFSIHVNSSSKSEQSKEIYSSFSWNDDVINFTFDLNQDRSTINAAVKSSRFQEMTAVLNYDIQAENKFARLATKVGSSMYILKAQSSSTPTNKTLQLKFKSPIQGLSLLQLSAELTSYRGGSLIREKVFTSLIRETFEAKLDAAFEMDLDTENPKLSILMSGYNFPTPKWNWLISLHSSRVPDVYVGIKLSKWKVEEEADTKKTILIQLKGSPASMQLSVDFPDVSKSIKANYALGFTKTQKSINFNFLQGKEKMFTMNGSLNFDKIGVLNFELKGYCHNLGTFDYTGVYKNRGKQSVVLTLKNNEHVNEIEGHFRYTIRDSYFDLEFESSLNNERHMRVKGSYDFNDPTVKSAWLYIASNNHELKAKFGGRVTSQLVSADMLVQSSIKAVENINLKFELSTPNPKENMMTLTARVNDADYKLTCTVFMEKFNVTSKLNVVFPPFTLKDLVYEVSLKDNTFRIITGLAGEELVSVMVTYDLTSEQLFYVAFDGNQRIFPFANEIFAGGVVIRPVAGTGLAYLSKRRSKFVSELPEEGETYFAVQGHITQQSKAFNMTLKYGNESNEVVFKYLNPEFNQTVVQAHLFLEAELPSLWENVTKIDLTVSSSSLNDEEFLLRSDFEFNSPLKFLSNLKNHMFLSMSPKSRQLDFTLNVVNRAEEGIAQVHFNFDKVNGLADFSIQEEFPNSRVPALKLSGACEYDPWKELKVTTAITVQKLTYSFEGEYKLDNEFHAGIIVQTPLQIHIVRFGGYLTLTDNMLDMRLYVKTPTHQFTYSGDLTSNSLNSFLSVFVPNYEFVSHFSATAPPLLPHKIDFDYSFQTSTHKYWGSLFLNDTLRAQISISELIDASECLSNTSEESSANCSVSNSKVGLLVVSVNETSLTSSYKVEASIVEREDLYAAPPKIKYQTGLSFALTNSDSKLSVESLVNLKKIRNKPVKIIVKKDWSDLSINFLDEVELNFVRSEFSSLGVGILNLQVFNVSHNLEWTYQPFDENLNLQVSFEFQSRSQPTKRLKMALNVDTGPSVADGRFIFSKENTNLTVNYNNGHLNIESFSRLGQIAFRSFVENKADRISFVGSFNKNNNKHMVSFNIGKSFPLESSSTIVSPLLPVEILKVSLKSENMTILFDIITKNQTVEPDLFVKIGIVPEGGSAFLYYKNSFFLQLSSFMVDGAFVRETNSVKKLYFSLNALYKDQKSEVMVSYASNGNQIVSSLSLQVPHQINDVQFTVSLPLMLSSYYNANFVLSVEKTLLYSGSLIFTRTDHENITDFSADVDFFSPSHKFKTILQLTRQESFVRHFAFSSNFKKSFVAILYNQGIIDETTSQSLSVFWNAQNVFDAKLGTCFDRSAFLIESEMQVMFASLAKKYAAKVQFLNKEEKKVALWVQYPSLAEKVGMDFSHHYNSIFNNSLLIQMNVPFVRALPSVLLNISNLIDVPHRSAALTYVCECDNSTMSVNVLGSLNYPNTSFSLGARLDHSAVGILLDKSASGLFLALTTPKEISDSLFINYSSKQNTLTIETKKSELLKLSYALELPNLEPATWYNQAFLIQLTALNPVQPVHFRFSQTIKSDLYEATALLRYRWDSSLDRLTGVGFTYTKTVSSRNIDVEIYNKQLQLRKEATAELMDYFAKVTLGNQNQLGVRVMKGKPEDSTQSLCLLTLYLPAKVLSFKAFKSPPSEGSSESTLGFGVASDDKEIAVQFTSSFEEDSSDTELSLSHFAYEHDIIVKTHFGPILKRFQVIYSEDVAEMFTVELQTISFEEEAVESSVTSTMISTSLMVVHRASKLMFALKLHSSESDSKIDSGLTISYHSLTTDSVKIIEILHEYNKSSTEMDFSVRSNQNVLKVGGGIQLGGFSAKLQTNHKEPLVFRLAMLSQKEKEFQLRYGDLRTCSLYLGMPNNKKVVVQTSTRLLESEEADALFTLQLNSSRLLWGKLLVPSETFGVVRDIFEEYSDLPVIVEHVYLGFLELGQENFFYPLTTIPGKFADFLETVVIRSAQEVRQVGASFDETGQIGAVVMDANHFYCRDIYDGLKTCFSFLETELAGLFKLISEVTSALKYAANEFLISVRQGFVLSYTRVLSVIEDIKDVSVSLKLVSMNLWNDVMRVNFNTRNFLESLIISLRHQLVIFERTVINQIQILEETIEQILLRFENYILTRGIVLQTYYDHFDESILQLEDKINGNLETLKDDLFKMEEFRHLMLLVKRHYPWLSQNHINTLIMKLKYLVDLVTEVIVDDLKSNFGDYAKSVQTSVLSTADQIEKYIDYPVFKSSFSFMNRVYQKLVWLRKYHSISLKMQENVRRLVQTINNYAQELEEILNPSGESSEEGSRELNTVVNMDTNMIEFSQELPFDWDGFDTKPHFEQLQQAQNQDSASSELNNFNTYRHQLLSGLYDGLTNIASENASASSLVPPFQAKGLLIGSQYFITFDGKVYNFSGTGCSYVLAGDFERKTVFVTVNYISQDGIPTKKSVSVLSGNTKVAINHLDRRVYINGNVSELPFTTRSLTATLVEPDHIIVKTTHGFTVDCNMYSDICRVQINGWMFGKTGGLLGTYDNEPANDFSLPNGTVTEEASDFIASWALQKSQCVPGVSIPKNFAKSEESVADCEFYFRSKISPFRSCFAKVSPEPFLELCKFGLRHPSFCSAAAAYLASCNMKSILNLPAECVSNDSNSNSLDERKTTVADIAFVVEDHSCILGSALKNISSMLSDVFHEDYDLVNIAVVGFGGTALPEPHIRTMKGKMWTQIPDYVNDTFSSDRHFRSVSPVASGAIPEALRYSLNLPWHKNASKTVILILCNELSTAHLEVLPELVEERINLQVISSIEKGEMMKPLVAYLPGLQVSPKLITPPSHFARTIMGVYLTAAYHMQVNGQVEPQHPWDQYEKELSSFRDDSISTEVSSEEMKPHNFSLAKSSVSSSILLSSSTPSSTALHETSSEPTTTRTPIIYVYDDYSSD